MRRRLLGWFAQDGRAFPWREPRRTPYEVVVAEILLQRTTAAAVAQAYASFLEHYPDWDSLAHAPLDALEASIRPLGRWRQRALAFQQLAWSIERHGGVLPHTRQELERLPGLGPYTASAVLALAVYGPSRCWTRTWPVSWSASSDHPHSSVASRTSGCIRSLFAWCGRGSLAVNWAALDFGALVCRPRSPHCTACPLRTACAYARALQPRTTST